jgi:hypothetical protein
MVGSGAVIFRLRFVESKCGEIGLIERRMKGVLAFMYEQDDFWWMVSAQAPSCGSVGGFVAVVELLYKNCVMKIVENFKVAAFRRPTQGAGEFRAMPLFLPT